MEIKVGEKKTAEQVFDLLSYFDDSSDTPLHEGLDFKSYSLKLSKFAYFILAYDNSNLVGFIAYYLNEKNKIVYVPQVVVHKFGRHKGIGHAMFTSLEKANKGLFSHIELEVLKENKNARLFYEREGFVFKDDHGNRLLLFKSI